jgi:hypothetical protein
MRIARCRFCVNKLQNTVKRNRDERCKNGLEEGKPPDYIIVKLSRLCNKGCGWVEGARMGEASPDWLIKVQIDTLTNNDLTPHMRPKSISLSSSRTKVQKQGYQSERSSSGQKFLNQRTIKHRLLERLGDLAPV